jgi:hypothetical protein
MVRLLQRWLRWSVMGCAMVIAAQMQASTVSTTYSRIEEMTGWFTCGNCGNTGSSGATANYYMTRGITSPTLDGSSSKYSISGGAPYSNGYWFIDHKAPTHGVTYLAYDFYLYIPSGYQNAPQAIEFECQQRASAWVYNFAWQANYAGNNWRYFNYGTRTWVSSGVALQRFSPGTWHHIVAEFHTNTSTHTVYHDALTVDGVRHAVNRATAAKYTGNWSNRFTNAFQLDMNGSDTAYHVYVDAMKVTMQYPQ